MQGIFKRNRILLFPLKGVPMQRVNEYQLYELATHIHPLTSVTADMKYSEVWFQWFQAREAIQTLFRQRALEVCYQAANELYLAIDNIVPRDWEKAIQKLPAEADLANESPIGWTTSYIKSAAEKFETIISAELSNSDTYWVSPKGTHKTSVLLQYAHLELPDSVTKEMPELKGDFDEAGRCLLFDNSTAVAFHLMRAIEIVIRKYYKQVTGAEPKAKFRNWGAYIKKLRESNAEKRITDHLDHVRENYRNPILHPEVNVTPEEAQVLFGVSVSTIFMLANEIKRLKATAGTALPFPATGTTGSATP